jgi:hypothetical protein
VSLLTAVTGGTIIALIGAVLVVSAYGKDGTRDTLSKCRAERPSLTRPSDPNGIRQPSPDQGSTERPTPLIDRHGDGALRGSEDD